MESPSSVSGYKNGCKNPIFPNILLKKVPSDLYGLLIITAIFIAIACPFTILLNNLVILTMKTKRRLQNPANVLLAYVAVTDVIMGLVVQPLYMTITVLLLQGKDFDDFCNTNAVFSISFATVTASSIHHLALVSWERYYTIKHSITHHIPINNARLAIASTLAWLGEAIISGVAPYAKAIQALHPAVILSIVEVQVLVYKEARRHERQILTHQVTSEARVRFEREKKALKITGRILAAIFGCYLPVISFMIGRRVYGKAFSADFQTVCRHLVFLPMLLNSVIIPIIYTIQSRQLRIAFIEIMSRKRYHEAEALERSVFQNNNNGVAPQTIRQAVGQQHHVRARNQLPGAADNQDRGSH